MSLRYFPGKNFVKGHRRYKIPKPISILPRKPISEDFSSTRHLITDSTHSDLRQWVYEALWFPFHCALIRPARSFVEDVFFYSHS